MSWLKRVGKPLQLKQKSYLVNHDEHLRPLARPEILRLDFDYPYANHQNLSASF